MGRMKALARGILVLVLYMCLQIGPLVVYIIGVTVGVVLDPQNQGITANELVQLLSYYLTNMEDAAVQENLMRVSAASALLAAAAFGYWYGKGRGKERGKKGAEGLRVERLCCAVAMALSLQALIQGVLNAAIAIKPEWFARYMELMDSFDIKGSVVALAYVALIAPISEELVFRGVIFHEAKKHTDFVTANLVQALLFGFMHLNLVQGVYAFVLGVFFGLVVEKGGRLAYSIGMHVAFNASSCLMLWWMPEELSTAWLAAAVLASLPVLAVSTRKAGRWEAGL